MFVNSNKNNRNYEEVHCGNGRNYGSGFNGLR